jgi:hypothetical protein
MESMTCDIAIKLYDMSVSYEINIKDSELYLITDAEILEVAVRGGMTLDAARMEVHDFVSNFLDGDSSMQKFNGTDMKFQGNDTDGNYYRVNTIIVYVNVPVPRARIEELVIALAEEFAGKEVPVEV